ncbi:hypothetical protein Ahia01_000479500 [Argonauta hians]
MNEGRDTLELLRLRAFLVRFLASNSSGRLLGEEDGLDVGQDTTLGDGYSGQQLVQLFVITNGQLQVTRNDSGFLVVSGSISCQLEHFSRQILHHGSQVNGSTSTNTLGIVAFSQQTMDTTDRELKSCFRRTTLGLGLDFSAFSTSRHVNRLIGGATAAKSKK